MVFVLAAPNGREHAPPRVIAIVCWGSLVSPTFSARFSLCAESVSELTAQITEMQSPSETVAVRQSKLNWKASEGSPVHFERLTRKFFNGLCTAVTALVHVAKLLHCTCAVHGSCTLEL